MKVEYDTVMECFVAIRGKKVVCLGAETYEDALVEAAELDWDDYE